MASKEFILQRICVYAGKNIDPASDKQVEEMLRSKFNIYLPQRSSMNESLAAVNSDHEVLTLIKQYRALLA
jgi:DNA polymerase I-like protein with 3'-5' exonuclease and polymerase domains